MSELDTQLHIADRLGYGNIAPALSDCVDTMFAKLPALMNANSKRGAA